MKNGSQSLLFFLVSGWDSGLETLFIYFLIAKILLRHVRVSKQQHREVEQWRAVCSKSLLSEKHDVSETVTHKRNL
jgi:hypothetical protein